MNELEDCRAALFREYESHRTTQRMQAAYRAALIESCGGDKNIYGPLFLKHLERLEGLSAKGQSK